MIDRRGFVGGAGAMLLRPTTAARSTTTRLRLWPDEPPGGGGPAGPERVDEKGTVTNVGMPSIEVFAPERRNGMAMLVAAGGGYARIALEEEGRPAARWLAARGITAFLLTYRLPSEGWRDGPLAPLQDAQRALRLIRAEAAGFGVDPGRVGVLGFSAGGHLLGMTAARAAFAAYRPIDATDRQSAGANAAALIYPVITLEPPYDDTSSRRVLIGPHPPMRASTDWSVQTHVTGSFPRCFLVQALDDPISKPMNTVIMADACRRAGVPVELHQPVSGGHGFAMGRPGSPTANWPCWYETWLQKVLPSPP